MWNCAPVGVPLTKREEREIHLLSERGVPRKLTLAAADQAGYITLTPQSESRSDGAERDKTFVPSEPCDKAA